MKILGIDHVAIAVRDLEESIEFFSKGMGLEVVEKRTTQGENTSMVSAVLKRDALTIVLVAASEDDSQVAQYIAEYGPGVQHVALAVSDIEECVDELKENNVDLATTLIRGEGIKQVFTRREKGSGMMFEYIERDEPGKGHFTDDNVNSLFRQLEAGKNY